MPLLTETRSEQVIRAGRTPAGPSFWSIVAAVILIALLFRLGIAQYSLWFDEQATMFYARQPLTRLWSGWMVRETNPPLYYSAIKGWIAVFGDSARAVRAPSILAGAAGMAVAAFLARQVYGKPAGVIAAILTALSAQQLYYSLQARPYECMFATAGLVLISMVSLERSWRAGRGWSGSLVVYALGCSVAIYLHTTMFLLPVICSGAIVLAGFRQIARQPALLLPLALADLAIAIASAWWLDISLQQILSGAQNIGALEIATPAVIFRRFTSTLFLVKATGVGAAGIALIVFLMAAWQAWQSRQMPETRLLLAVLAIGLLLFGVIGFKVPIFLPRTIYWLSLIPTVLCAAALAGIGRPMLRRAAILAVTLLVTLNMATSARVRQSEDWDGAIRAAQRLPGSRLIVESAVMAFLLQGDCNRLEHGACPVPIIAIIAPEDREDMWASGLYRGPSVPIDRLAMLPVGRYFLFSKEFNHHLLPVLHSHGLATALRDDLPLIGPVDRAALIR